MNKQTTALTTAIDLWRKKVYTAESTINFYDFCAERGYYAQREELMEV